MRDFDLAVVNTSKSHLPKIGNLLKGCDTILVVDNNELLDHYLDLTVEATFDKETEKIGTLQRSL